TVTVAVANAARSLAKIVAVNWLLLTKVVCRSSPFHRMTDAETKFPPLTVSMNPAEPTTAPCGLIELIDGTGNEIFPTPDRPTMYGLPGVPSTIVKVAVR